MNFPGTQGRDGGREGSSRKISAKFDGYVSHAFLVKSVRGVHVIELSFFFYPFLCHVKCPFCIQPEFQ